MLRSDVEQFAEFAEHVSRKANELLAQATADLAANPLYQRWAFLNTPVVFDDEE